MKGNGERHRDLTDGHCRTGVFSIKPNILVLHGEEGENWGRGSAEVENGSSQTQLIDVTAIR